MTSTLFVRRVSTSDLKPVFLLVLGATISVHCLAFYIMRGEASGGTYDFPTFYGAAQIIKDESGKGLYDEGTEKRAQEKFLPTGKPFFPFIHPAFEALIFVPFTGLSHQRAYLAWCAINCVILFVLPLLLMRYLNGLRAVLGSPLVVLAPLAFFPAFMTVLVGQDSILLLLVYALVFIALKRGREPAAGALLALGLFRFQLIIPFVPLFLTRRKWSALAGFAVAAGLLCLVSIVITGWQGTLDYVRLLAGAAHALPRGKNEALYVANPVASMASLRGFIQTQFQGWLPVAWMDASIAIVSLLFLAGALREAWKAERQENKNPDLLFALFLTVALLVSFHTFLYDLTLLLLPILLVLNDLIERPDFRRPRRLVLFAVILLLFFDPVYLLGLQFSQLSLLALPVAALAVLTLKEVSTCEAA